MASLTSEPSLLQSKQNSSNPSLYNPSWLKSPAIKPEIRTIDHWKLNVARSTSFILPIKVYTSNATLSVDFTASFQFPFQIAFVNQFSQAKHTDEETKEMEQILYPESNTNNCSVKDLVAPSSGYFLLSFNNKSSWVTSLSISQLQINIIGDIEAPCYAIGSILVTPVPKNPRDMQLSISEARCLAIIRGYIETNPDLCNEPMVGQVPLVHDTDTLLRFTRARDADPIKTMEMLTKHIEWRRQTLPIALKEFEAEIPKRRIYACENRSSTGHHVVVVRCYRILQEGYEPDVLVNMQLDLVRQFEEMDRMESWNDRGTRHPASYTTIVDTTGIKKPPIDYLQKLGDIFGNNFPERSWRTLILPVPGFVRVLVNGMLWFLDPVTKQKISICSTNEQGAVGAELELDVMKEIMQESLEYEGKLIGENGKVDKKDEDEKEEKEDKGKDQKS